MGEIADDIIDGLMCSHCSVYFVKAHGYCVLCEECFRSENKEGQMVLKKATYKEV